MVVRGRVRNAIVVLDEGVRLPEGLEVTVLAPNIDAGILEAQRHSILAIPPVSLGQLLRPLTADDDLLGEILEGRS